MALKSGRILNEEEYAARKKALSQVIDYNPMKTYWIGQRIHHASFEDSGEIVRKKKSDGGQELIVVKFEKLGEKMLVEGLKD